MSNSDEIQNLEHEARRALLLAVKKAAGDVSEANAATAAQYAAAYAAFA